MRLVLSRFAGYHTGTTLFRWVAGELIAGRCEWYACAVEVTEPTVNLGDVGHGKMVVVKVGSMLTIDAEAVGEFCRSHGIRRLAVFGSAVRDDFRPDSDVDVLVVFDSGRIPGLLRLAQMELALSELFGGREVELRTYQDLSPLFRDEVRSSAVPLYEAA